MLNGKLLAEARRLAAASKDKKLHAPQLVEAAKDPSNPFHDRFDWNVKKAAYKWWLCQARAIIAEIEIVKDDSAESTRPAFVSLASDRHSGGGYTPIERVLSSDALRNELLQTVISELVAIKDRHDRIKELTELQPIFEQIDSVSEQFGRKNKQRGATS